MMFMGKKTFGEFLASDQKTATNILSDRLERPEDAGVQSSRRDTDNTSKYNYTLT